MNRRPNSGDVRGQTLSQPLIMTLDRWTLAEDTIAIKEGWSLFDSDAEATIQRVDDPTAWDPKYGLGPEPIFESDEDAVAHVKKRAAEGSPLHMKALAMSVTALLEAAR